MEFHPRIRVAGTARSNDFSARRNVLLDSCRYCYVPSRSQTILAGSSACLVCRDFCCRNDTGIRCLSRWPGEIWIHGSSKQDALNKTYIGTKSSGLFSVRLSTRLT